MRASEFIIEALSPQALDITASKLGQLLMDKLQRDTRYKKFIDPKQFIVWVADEIDPTKNSQYTKWILNGYINNGIRFIEDLHKLTEPLVRYNKLVQSGKLPVEYRDINKFKNMNSFLDLMDQYQDTKTNREIRDNEEQRLIETGQAKIYKDTGDIKIVIPHTKEAAMYYGRGTRWCTAATNDNFFEHYNYMGPLFIIIFRNSGQKWQFHFQSNQFMNEKDESLFPEQVQPISNLFPKESWLRAVKRYGYAIAYVKNPNEELQLAAVKEAGLAIRHIENPSEEVQLVAVKRNDSAIRYIENPTETVQLVTVKLNPYLIRYIKNPSDVVKLAAVKKYGRAIRFIENPTEQMQIAAIKEDGRAIEYIYNPSEKAQLAAIKLHPELIEYIKNPTEKVQLAAVKMDRTVIARIENPTEKVKQQAGNRGVTYNS